MTDQQRGWLIEFVPDLRYMTEVVRQITAPQWWDGSGWVADSLKAVCFCRAEDAVAIARTLPREWLRHHRITEHIWS